MSLPRFRLRTLMIAVAVVAILMGGIVLVQRSREYQRRAVLYGRLESLGRSQEDMLRKAVAAQKQVLKTERLFNKDLGAKTLFERDLEQRMKSDAERAERAVAFAEYGARLRAKYLHAASKPWKPV